MMKTTLESFFDYLFSFVVCEFFAFERLAIEILPSLSGVLSNLFGKSKRLVASLTQISFVQN